MNEYEKLQAEIDRLSAEVDELKKKLMRKRGRPGVDAGSKARVVALYSQGHSMRSISEKTGLALGTVHKIISCAREGSNCAYMYMDKDMPSTLIETCSISRTVKITNFTDDLLSRAFGINEAPAWEDYEDFLEYRCMPRERFRLKDELKELGADSYDPVLIIEKTKGRLYDDNQWLERLDRPLLDECEEIINSKKDPGVINRELGELVCAAAGA